MSGHLGWGADQEAGTAAAAGGAGGATAVATRFPVPSTVRHFRAKGSLHPRCFGLNVETWTESGHQYIPGQ